MRIDKGVHRTTRRTTREREMEFARGGAIMPKAESQRVAAAAGRGAVESLTNDGRAGSASEGALSEDQGSAHSSVYVCGRQKPSRSVPGAAPTATSTNPRPFVRLAASRSLFARISRIGTEASRSPATGS